jgi:hypothetical protein
MRRVPEILAQCTGILLTQSAINQMACTLTAPGSAMANIYEDLRVEVATSPIVHTDDTGWRINAMAAYVMGFFTAQASYFQIRSQHRHQEVLGLLFAGVLVTDRGTSYRAREFLEWLQQKCLSHLLKNCSKVHESKVSRGRDFSAQLMALMREAIALWHEFHDTSLSLQVYLERVADLKARLAQHLRERQVRDPDNQRLLDGIGEVFRLGQLTLFLDRPEVEPTNNRAERGLRPAVISRKVSQCSKTQSGARAYATLKTVFCTLALRTNSVVTAFAGLLKGHPFPAPLQAR